MRISSRRVCRSFLNCLCVSWPDANVAISYSCSPACRTSINCGTHEETNRDQCITVLVWLVWLFSRSSLLWSRTMRTGLEDDSRSSNNHLWGSYVTAEHNPGKQHQVNVGSKPMKQLIQSLCQASTVTVAAPRSTHKNSVPSSSSDETCCSRCSSNISEPQSPDQPGPA